jgi:heme/copper-type cytochrome/quinol oxidase subunit 3
MSDVAALDDRRLPVGSLEYRATGWWAMLLVLLTEGALFAYLLFSYYYVTVQPHSGPWPPEMPKFLLSLPNTIILLLSSVAMWFGEYGTKRGIRWLQLLGIAGAIVLGTAFVIIQFFEWSSRPFTMSSGTYGSLYFTVTGFHVAHVVAGLLILLTLLFWSWRGYFGPIRHSPVSIGAIYWHFVDAVWLAVFFTFYITPYLS